MASKLTKRYLNLISIKLDKKEKEATDKRGYMLLKCFLDFVLPEACSEEAIQDFFSTVEELEKEL